MSERLVVTTMRNEGPFILEWVAWYHMLGFDHIMIFYNECSDGSPELLALLEAAGYVTAIPFIPDPKRPIKRTSHTLMFEHPRIRAAEWVINIDVDEFLVVHAGDGSLGDLIAQYDLSDTHGIAVHWRCFGDSKRSKWIDELTHQTFLSASETHDKANIFFKSLIRWPATFKHVGDHSPRIWSGKGYWGSPPNKWYRGDGRLLKDYNPDADPIKYTRSKDVTHEYAQLNHYVTRTRESFNLKRGNPSSSANQDRYTEHFFKTRNRNERKDSSASKYKDRFDVTHQTLTAIPGALKLHHQCCQKYVERLGVANKFDHKTDPRWMHHKRAAEHLS